MMVMFLVALSVIAPPTWWLVWALSHDRYISADDWQVLGDLYRSLGGIYAVTAASIAAWIAWVTNQTRSREAEGVQFREYMKWSVEKLSSQQTAPAHTIEDVFALSLIERYANQTRPNLDPTDKAIAVQLLQFIDRTTSEPEEFPDPLQPIDTLSQTENNQHQETGGRNKEKEQE